MFSNIYFFFSSRRRHTRYWRDWSSDVCSSDLNALLEAHGASLVLKNGSVNLTTEVRFAAAQNVAEQLSRQGLWRRADEVGEMGIHEDDAAVLVGGTDQGRDGVDPLGQGFPAARSEERRVGKSVDLGGRRIINK